MLGFWKRRRLAREAAAEASRKKLLERMAVADRHERIAARQSGLAPSSSSPSAGLGLHDPLHSLSPLNPLSPLGVYSQVDAYAAPRSEPEPVRSHCSPSVSDDSWSRSSSSGSDYSCSGSSYDSGSSSGYDSSSSSSSSDSSY
jgi:hypothetical protein